MAATLSSLVGAGVSLNPAVFPDEGSHDLKYRGDRTFEGQFRHTILKRSGPNPIIIPNTIAFVDLISRWGAESDFPECRVELGRCDLRWRKC